MPEQPTAPNPTDAPTQAPSPTTAALVAAIAHPLNSEYQPAANRDVLFEATAYDPLVGTNNGDGIDHVDMDVISPSGHDYKHTEKSVPYCAFGQDNNTCLPLQFFATGNRWPDGKDVENGEYTFKITAVAPDGRSMTAELKVQVNVLPWLAFVSMQNGNQELMVTNLDGSVVVPLTNEPGRHHIGPVYQPKGDRLLMVAASTNGFDITNQNDIFTMKADGSDVQLLTLKTDSHLYPSWSPDGKHIVYAANDLNKRDIYVIDADGKNLKNLTPNLTNSSSGDPAYNTQPAWSPDGKYIAFRSDATGHEEIYVMKADGSNMQQITNLQANLFYPAWSPDSKHIVFDSDKQGAMGIYVVERSGANLQNLSQNQPDSSASWSPDGKKLVFMSSDGGTQGLSVMDADGSNRQVLQQGNITFPAWSPDGKQIAYLLTAPNGSQSDLYIIQADSTQWVKIALNVGGSQPAWVP